MLNFGVSVTKESHKNTQLFYWQGYWLVEAFVLIFLVF